MALSKPFIIAKGLSLFVPLNFHVSITSSLQLQISNSKIQAAVHEAATYESLHVRAVGDDPTLMLSSRRVLRTERVEVRE